MKIIKIILIIAYTILNSLTSNFYENNDCMNNAPRNEQWSQEVTIEDHWYQTADTGWRDYNFYGYGLILPNRKIMEMQWTAAVNAEYYGWQTSAKQNSSTSDDQWFKEKSVNGDQSYPFQIRVWRDWWSCGNSALMIEMRINGQERRILKFHVNLWSCWKLDYSEGFKLTFQVKYEDQYQTQMDKFNNNLNKNNRTINTPTNNLEAKWMTVNGITTLKNEITNDLVNNIIKPTFNQIKNEFKNNHIFTDFSNFTKNIKFNGYANFVNVSFRPEYYYNNSYTTNDITIRYNLNIKPDFDYYQNQMNQFYQKLNNKKFNLAVATFDENTSWIKNKKSTNIKTEIENHLLNQIELTINELKANFNSNNIFQSLSNFYQNLQIKHLNNKQVKVTINPQYHYQNYNKVYYPKNIVTIIYNLTLDYDYLVNDIDSRIKYFINNQQQNQKIIKLNINNQEQEFIAFNEKVDLEFFPLRNNDPRKSLLEEIIITSSDGKIIALEDQLINSNSKFPWKFTTTLTEPNSSENEIKNEVIFYNIKVLRYTTNSSGEIDKAAPTEVYNKNILIKETNPGIKFLYRAIVKDQEGNAKAVSNLLPETVIYNEKLDNLIPLEFSVKTKHILLDNENINQIFNNISSWMVSTKATKAQINANEIPFLKQIRETNSNCESKIYDFTKVNGLEQWESVNKTWSGIANGYLKYDLQTVFYSENPSYRINQIDLEVENLLIKIAQIKENLIAEKDKTKQIEYESQIKSLEEKLYARMTIIQNTNNINSFWNSNLGRLIKNHYRHFDQQSLTKKSLQEVKILINEFLQWVKNVNFPGENNEDDKKDLKLMTDQEKANYLAAKIIAYFQINNNYLTYSDQLNTIINFDEKFNFAIKKRLFSWLSDDKKAQAILKTENTKLQLNIYENNKELHLIKISENEINLKLKITIIYNKTIANFTPYINLIIKNGNSNDDFNKENKEELKDSKDDNKDADDEEKIKDENKPDLNNKDDNKIANKDNKENKNILNTKNSNILTFIFISFLSLIFLGLILSLVWFKQKRKKRLVS